MAGAGDFDVNANDVVAFLVEIVTLGLLGVAGWQASGSTPVSVLRAVGLPLVAAVLWGVFAAPRAVVSSGPLRLGVKVLVLGAGVVAGFLVLPPAVAVVVAAVVLVNTALMYVGPLARHSVD
jgi:hypothetical protein